MSKQTRLDDGCSPRPSWALSAVDEEYLHSQPVISLGVVGHVAHGKSTLVKALSGATTQRDSREKERNITIKLGFANAKIFRCDGGDGDMAHDTTFRSTSSKVLSCHCPLKTCRKEMHLVNHISFVDCPGHQALMATMLRGSAVMDAALLVIAANDACPAPQTTEHLAALDIVRSNKSSFPICVVLNKVELVTAQEARSQLTKVHEFIADTIAADADIIPASAQLGINIDLVLRFLAGLKPGSNASSAASRISVIRSFDVNKPGAGCESLVGGVAGGSIVGGSVCIGQQLEIRPGIPVDDGEELDECKGVHCPAAYRPLFTYVRSLQSVNVSLTTAHVGGLVGIGTTLDPVTCKADKLVGQVMGEPYTLPPVLRVLYLRSFRLLRGSRKIRTGESVKLQCGTVMTEGKCEKRSKVKGAIRIVLSRGVCIDDGATIAASVLKDGRWSLVGFGNVVANKSTAASLVYDREARQVQMSHSASVTLSNQNEIESLDMRSDSGATSSAAGAESVNNTVPQFEKYLCRFSTHLEKKGRGFRFTNSRDALVRAKVPTPLMMRNGGRQCSWINFAETCVALNRCPNEVAHFVLAELGVTSWSFKSGNSVAISKSSRETDATDAIANFVTALRHGCPSPPPPVAVDYGIYGNARCGDGESDVDRQEATQLRMATADVSRIAAIGMRGNFRPKNICRALSKFIKQRVQCDECGQLSTELRRERSLRRDILICLKCEATRTLSKAG